MSEYGGAEFPIVNNNGSINKVPNSNSQPENQMERTGLTDAFAAGLVFPQETSIMKRNEHYIDFFVNQQQNATIKFKPKEKGGFDGKLVSGSFAKPKEKSNLSVPRPPTQRTLGHIRLYLPAQLNVAHKTNYGEAEIGLGVASFLAARKGLAGMDRTLAGIKAAGIGAFKQVLQSGKQTVVNAAETAGATGAKAAFAIITGETQNNRTEMKFEGIDRRTFSYSFRLLPRSSKEAETVKNIVDVFRMQSLPEVSKRDGLGRTLTAPSTFDIEYHPQEHLHMISTCVLESVNVKYGGERPQFFEDNYPVETQLDLQFKELEIITKERVMAGY